MFINCLHIIPPRQYPESLRQPPDTSQTLSRQPSDIPGEKKPADQNYSNWIYVNQYHIIPSTNINRFGVVWNMSEGVWMTLDTAWMVIMPNQLLKLQWRNIDYCFDWMVPFISMTLDWQMSVLFWVVLRVRGRCLGWCLELSEWFWISSGLGWCGGMTWNWLT